MKDKTLEILKKVKNGELSLVKANNQLWGLFSISGNAYFDSDFVCPDCGSTAAEPPLRLTARIRSGTWKCSDCGYDYEVW